MVKEYETGKNISSDIINVNAYGPIEWFIEGCEKFIKEFVKFIIFIFFCLWLIRLFFCLTIYKPNGVNYISDMLWLLIKWIPIIVIIYLIWYFTQK